MLRNILGLGLFVMASSGWAATIDFEGLADSTSVGSTYAGLDFTNATILSAGISLNEVEFPPRSGTNVIFDGAGPITIVFSTPISYFEAYFTYVQMLTLSAFDATNTPLGDVSSLFDSNFTSSGMPPNELISLTNSAITKVVITGSPDGGSFTMDDLSFRSGEASSPVPEPSSASFVLLAGGLLMGAFTIRQLHSQRVHA
jgi:hypothetical protein